MRLLNWIACKLTKHPIEPVYRTGSLSVWRCSRCGIGGLRHSAETPDGLFLPLRRREIGKTVAELRVMEETMGRSA